MFNNLRELILSMPTEEQCREYLAEQRWNGKPECPYCGHGRAYKIEGGKRYKCANDECYKKFSVTVGTVFEASKIPLVKWFTAVYLAASHKKGISSYQLGKDIGVSQKCSWFMLHRIREIMRVKDNIKLDNIVEVDEVYMGGKVGNMSKSKRKQLREEGNTMNTKIMVMGMIERGGNLKLITMGKPNEKMSQVQQTIRENVDTDAVLVTDSFGGYNGLDNVFAAHEVVNHSEHEYVRDKVFHTNSIEGAFSHFKRSIYGIYHQCTPKHLSRYADETMFRYNLRKMTDASRFTLALQNVDGRLKWKDLTDKENETPESKIPISFPQNTFIPSHKKNAKPVHQILGGEIVATYQTLLEAQAKTGIKWQNISRVARGKKNTTGGYQWKYA
jgi:transposase-like protein